ncbi:hypothetical protein BCY91_14135 [Pelobium manganitolerans]|uniref:Uncharacterized protein n=1 Tax=Pelobium manganitolerans TaxID=1842495 RepID=A0A419S9V8_9SPHI|nr:hypothetical protein [Pelobium manganitolerans]RKD19012.1 hypothetical protein BCY91_14135 [Pelobium manganitolerans]
MSICGKITKNQAFDCAAPMTGGAKDAVYVFNHEDIDTLTRDVANPQVLRGITMKGATKGFLWEGPPNSVIASAKLQRKKYKNSYEQIVGVPLMANTSELKTELEKAGYGKFLVIVENNHQVGDSIFEVYFLDRGGILIKNERDIVNADLEGGYDINFGQEDTARESHLPATFAVTASPGDDGEGQPLPAVYSYAATKSALEALISAT